MGKLRLELKEKDRRVSVEGDMCLNCNSCKWGNYNLWALGVCYGRLSDPIIMVTWHHNWMQLAPLGSLFTDQESEPLMGSLIDTEQWASGRTEIQALVSLCPEPMGKI